ncbi:protein adenylyltransferase SelO [Formosa haliotis]|uniref:protein adenylyltransferase SelO n=1 Tax=Formosa haliotis TaxID=1555194 RepID=UPI000824AB71|nr:YdiU family protein [Formosa haliotis]
MKTFKTHIHSNFTETLPADPIQDNTRRQVTQACFSYVTPKQTKKPELVHVSPEMLAALGISETESQSEGFLKVFTGNTVLPGTTPYAMCYGGHQFGNWAGQLGDGRAINLTEIDYKGKHWALQLKGAGETPYSRTADGLAVLRSSIREYLCSEAMFHLGVPTTRALSLAITGDQVLRDVMYNGNPEYEPGAIVCRVAPSFLRFGSFEIFAAREDVNTLKLLTDYTITQFYPEFGGPSKDTYLAFFKAVSQRTLKMIIDWQRVGFVHGVMNTDNLSILGLTIDYGPYGWLEGFDFGWTPNTTDRQHKRYRYGNQPNIGLWNLYQLANALYPLIGEAEGLQAVLDDYKTDFETQSLAMMRAKIGFEDTDVADLKLIQDLEDLLQVMETDMTIFFRRLSQFEKDHPEVGFQIIEDAFYNPKGLTDETTEAWNTWFQNYANRLQQEKSTDADRAKRMNALNPKYVLRNYMAQLAIDDAEQGDYGLVDELFQLLKNPYAEQPESEKWFAKRPEWARNKVGCSMLSCSS